MPLTIGGTMRTMSDEELTMSSPLPERLRRNVFLTVVALVTFIAILSGTAFALSMKHHTSAITKKEYAFASALVRKEIRQEDAVLTSATVTLDRGKISASKPNYPCASGLLLYVKLIGNFPHIAISPVAGRSGTPNIDTTVHAINLTADAKSGRVCLIGVQTGKATPVPNALSLPIN